jgi:hypothetical protein
MKTSFRGSWSEEQIYMKLLAKIQNSHVSASTSRSFKLQVKPSNSLTFLEIVESDQPCSEFTVEIVVRLIDRPQARVGVVVGVHAEAEWFVFPHWGLKFTNSVIEILMIMKLLTVFQWLLS